MAMVRSPGGIHSLGRWATARDPQPKAGRVGIPASVSQQESVTPRSTPGRGPAPRTDRMAAAAALVSRSAPAAELGSYHPVGADQRGRLARGHRPAPGERDRPRAGQVTGVSPGQRTRDSGPVTAWGMAGSPGLVSGAAEPRTAAPPSTAAASPKAAP